MSINRQVHKKIWYIYTIEYYAAINMDEIVSFEATWMDQEFIMPSKISQTEKDKCHMIPFISEI